LDANGYLADPHTAIGIAAARALPPGCGIPVVTMATAHPAKFPEAMNRATGQRPALPTHMADLFKRDEIFTVLPNDLTEVEAAVRALAGRNHSFQP
jgi:threonine synthase